MPPARRARRGRVTTGTGQRLVQTQSEVLGVKELAKVFKDLPVKLQRTALKSALEASGQVMLAAQQRYVPVRTGALKASLHVWPVNSTKKYSRVSVGTHPEVFYAPWVEYGTANAPAQPFMRPALDAAFSPTTRRFTETFGDGLDEAVDALAQQHHTL
jgi:HK97 gp10 family phage protein